MNPAYQCDYAACPLAACWAQALLVVVAWERKRRELGDRRRDEGGKNGCEEERRESKTWGYGRGGAG